MKRILGMLIATTLSVGLASAAVISDYSTDFTLVDGFADGLTPNGVDGWVTRNAPATTTDATGSYGALVINANGPAMAQAGAGGTLAVGESVVLTASVFYNGTFSGNSDLHLGLSNVGTDAAANRAGIMLRRSAAGAIQIIPQSIGGTEDGANNITGITAVAGQANALTFTTTITKTSTADTFDVSYSIGTVSGSFQAVNSTIYGDASDVYGIIDFNGATGGQTQVDSFSQTVIPEPATMGLVGIFGGAVIFVRRRLSV